jgi:SNW domain-containing protein 1
MSLSSLLPKPTLSSSKWAVSDNEEDTITTNTATDKKWTYGNRAGFLPTLPEHFGDGGSFPEIHIIQYPLDMGRPKEAGADSIETLPLQRDADGKIRYDMVLHQGEGEGSKRIVHSQLKDTLNKDIVDDRLPPDEQEVQKTTEKTQEALDKLLNRNHV